MTRSTKQPSRRALEPRRPPVPAAQRHRDRKNDNVRQPKHKLRDEECHQ